MPELRICHDPGVGVLPELPGALTPGKASRPRSDPRAGRSGGARRRRVRRVIDRVARAPACASAVEPERIVRVRCNGNIEDVDRRSRADRVAIRGRFALAIGNAIGIAGADEHLARDHVAKSGRFSDGDARTDPDRRRQSGHANALRESSVHLDDR